MTKSSTVTLASGHEMPIVGFGLWKVPAENAADTVYNAIKAGYRLFDGAYDYSNEKESGEGIQRAIKDGLVKREEIFVTTKLWNNYHKKEHALKMIKAQNEAWGLGYLDLVLIHFPCPLKYIEPSVKAYAGWWLEDGKTENLLDNVPTRETWEALEQLVDEGIAKSIGVSNFQSQQLYDIQTYAKHPISSLQVEHHPYLAQPQLVKMAQENKIVVTAYSSFGPQSFVELQDGWGKRSKGVPSLFDAEPVQAAAKAHGKTPSQVLLRWATQRDVAVIPKSNNPGRMIQNLDVLSFDLTSKEMDAINGLDCNLRMNDPGQNLEQRPLRIFA